MVRPIEGLDAHDFISEYTAGHTVQDIAARHGVSGNTVRRRMAAAGFYPTKVWSPPDLGALVQEYEAGASVLALATRHGVSRNVIDRVLAAAGVRKRTPSEQSVIRNAAFTPEQRKANAAAAHDAVRGKPLSPEHVAKRAIGKQQSRAHVSPAETHLAELLRARGVETVPQLAVGPYNVDLAAHPVAVEVLGGGWHGYGAHAARAEKRSNYLLDRGWSLVFVHVPRFPADLSGAADYIAAFAKVAGRHPSGRGEYRVVRSSGETVPGTGRYLYKAAGVQPCAAG